jgi:hypothetical protein
MISSDVEKSYQENEVDKDEEEEKTTNIRYNE